MLVQKVYFSISFLCEIGKRSLIFLCFFLKCNNSIFAELWNLFIITCANTSFSLINVYFGGGVTRRDMWRFASLLSIWFWKEPRYKIEANCHFNGPPLPPLWHRTNGWQSDQSKEFGPIHSGPSLCTKHFFSAVEHHFTQLNYHFFATKMSACGFHCYVGMPTESKNLVYIQLKSVGQNCLSSLWSVARNF